MKYFGYYADGERAKESNCTLAAVNKMSYIAEVIAFVSGKAEIISRATRKESPQKNEIVNINEAQTIQYFANTPHNWKINRFLCRQIDRIRFVVWMLKNIRKSEKVLVYHSLGYMNEIAFVHRIKKFKLILEVEEIYSDVTGQKYMRKKEVKFLQRADAYILPTKLLSDAVNPNGKPEVIIHGTYQVEPDEKCDLFHKNLQNERKQTIHCVYAGTLDPRKGGAVAAATAVKFLSPDYHIHILGFGSKKDIQEMEDLIAKISLDSSAKITYDGVLSGKQYIRFIQSCDIGLSTQEPNAAFNGSSFPSKILSYMANGLRVVSIRIPAIETSAVGNMVFYYDKQTPEDIAKAIMSIDLNDKYDSREYIRQLSDQFEKDMKKLLTD